MAAPTPAPAAEIERRLHWRALGLVAFLLIILGAFLLLRPWFDKRQLFGKAEQACKARPERDASNIGIIQRTHCPDGQPGNKQAQGSHGAQSEESFHGGPPWCPGLSMEGQPYLKR